MSAESFWWVDEISAPEQYFADQPDERRQFLVNINQDMVGAKQSVEIEIPVELDVGGENVRARFVAFGGYLEQQVSVVDVEHFRGDRARRSLVGLSATVVPEAVVVPLQ